MDKCKSFFSLIFFGLLAFSSCNESNMKDEVSRINEQKSRITTILNKLSSTNNLEEYSQLLSDANLDQMNLAVDRESLSAEDKRVFDSLQNSIVDFLENAKLQIEQTAVEKSIAIVNEEDILLQKGEKQFAVYLYKGDEVSLNISLENATTEVSVENQETQNVVFSKKSDKIQEKIAIRFPSLYLITIHSPIKQYADIQVERKSSSIENFTASTAVISDTILCEKSDKGAFPVQEYEFINVYENPVKVTLASQGRALLGNSYRSVVSVQLPQGVTDWFYTLRLATSKDDISTDGDFCGNVLKTYHSKKFFGKTVYESERTVKTGILDDLLNTISSPKRDEEAYCNFYVIKSAKDARSFQNEAGTFLYNLDYSLKGTQSNKGHIVTEGLTSWYIGLENPRFTTSIYVWLEVVATKPTTKYYKVVYKKAE